jgi:O-antigen ligase
MYFMNRSFLQRSIDYGLLAVLLLFPVSVNMAWLVQGDKAHPLFSANVCIADLLIFIVFMIWVAKTIVYKEWKNVKWPPAPIFAFIGFGFLSFINAFSIGEWAKELIKVIEYFLLLYILLENNLRSIRVQVIMRVFFVTTTVILLIAFVQHFFLKEDEYLIRGMFSNNNILGIFLCIAVPLIYSRLIFSTDYAIKIWMSILLVLAFLVLLSGSALLSPVISLLVMTVITGRKRLLYLYCATILLAGVLYTAVMPDRNVRAIRDFGSLYEQGSISRSYYHRIETQADNTRDVLVQKDFGDKYFQIAEDFYLKKTVPPIVDGGLYQEMDGKKHIKSRYLEMQASLNLLAENASLGVGLGNYQNNIGKYYYGFPKINTAQPNEDNGYLVIAATSGILGLSAFLWIFLRAIKYCRKGYQLSIGKEKALFWGLLGSLTAILIENFFSYILSVSLLVPILFLIYLSSKNISHADHQAE